MTNTSKWTKTPPEEEGFYWCRYKGKHGLSRVPCEYVILGEGQWIVRTTGCASFTSNNQEDLMFGPKIKMPDRIKEDN